MDTEMANNVVEVSLIPKRKGRRARKKNRSRGAIDPAQKHIKDCGTPIADPVNNKRWKNGRGNNKGVADNKQAENALITSDLNSVRTLGLSDEKNSEQVFLAKLVCLGIGDEENSPSETVSSLSIRASITYVRRKLLVLDLNGVLVDLVSRPPKDYKADIRIAKQAGFKRPFCDDFLNFCFERFEVGIWSSRLKKNIDKLVNFLLGDMKQKLLFCWDLSHCTATKFGTLEDRHKPVVFKEVRRIWEKHEPEFPWKKGFYNESNTLLLDDSPYKALLNPANTAIFPYSYQFQNESDNSLGVGGDLRDYLEDLAASTNVQEFVEKHPFGQSPVTEKSSSWGFYLRIIMSLQPSPVAHMR